MSNFSSQFFTFEIHSRSYIRSPGVWLKILLETLRNTKIEKTISAKIANIKW